MGTAYASAQADSGHANDALWAIPIGGLIVTAIGLVYGADGATERQDAINIFNDQPPPTVLPAPVEPPRP